MEFTQKYHWKIVLSYFFLATGISLIFRVYEPGYLDFIKLPYGFGLNLVVGFGPLLAAFLCRKLFKDVVVVRKLPLFGTSIWRSIAFVLAPVVVLCTIGIGNQEGLNIHLLGLKTGLMWLIYIYGEEYGWRGYLQQLLPGNTLVKALIIGILWYFWHLSFLFDHYDLLKELIFLLVLTVGSYIALLVTNRTDSLLTALGFHFSFSVMTNIPFTVNYKYGVIIMVVFWAILLWSWKRNFGYKKDRIIN